MKVKFETIFRGWLLLLLVILAWSLWAGAQTATNPPAAATSGPPARLLTEVERLDEHPLTFGLDRVAPLREIKLLGEPVWKYLASLAYVLLAFYASKLIDFVAQVWLKRLTAKTDTTMDDLLLDLLHGPLKVIVFVVLLNIGLNVFDWSERVRLYLSKGMIVLVAGALTYLAIKIVNLSLDIWRKRTAHEGDRKFDDQLFSLIRISTITFVIVVAVLVTAQNLNINITAALASLSVGGLAVGLAAQDTLGNLFGAVAVFIDKPFRVGDSIKLDGAEGVVEEVGLRSTRLRSPDGHLVAVPNKTMGNAILTNLSQRPHIKTTMNLVLAPATPTEKVRRALEVLREIYQANPMTQEVWVSFNQFIAGSLNISIVHWWKGSDYQKYLAGMQEMNLAVKERFETEGIRFAAKADF